MKKVLLTIIGFFYLAVSLAQSIVSMSPNSIVQGASSYITSTVTGSATWFQNGSPPNSITEAYISNGINTYYGDIWSIWTTDDEHADIPFNVGTTPALGPYSLVVTYYDPNVVSWPYTTTLSLPNAFTVLAPDGYVQGTVFEDVNQNGVQDVGEAGLQGLSLTVNPGNLSFTTGVNGVFSYPLTNGSYTLTYNNSAANYYFITTGTSNPINFTIASGNSAGNNFPLYKGLNSIYPDTGWAGQSIWLNVYSDKGIFRPSNVNLGTNTRLRKSIGTAYTINSIQYNYIDTNHAQIRFTIPNGSQYLGAYNLEVTTSTPYSGKHILPSCFDVVSAPLYINGSVFFDTDSNGIKDIGEVGIANQKILLMPDSTFAFSDANGNYTFGSSSGSKTISWVTSSGFLLQSNNVASYTQNIAITTSGFNFGLKSANPNYSCDIINLYGAGRCNVSNIWNVHYRNTGSTPYNGWIYVTKSANVSYVSSGIAPTFISNDTIAWYLTNIPPCQSQYLYVYLLMPSAGQSAHVKATMHSLDGTGNIVYADEFTRPFVVSCAWDPNDKGATPVGIDAPHYTLKNEALEYLVRFQNTGNDTAFTVLIRDTIDTNFDLATLNVIASSHLMKTEVDLETRVTKFIFNNILLPDSNVNEPASHGYLVYNIKPKIGVPDLSVVKNDADIYFDFNPPVITNETFNTLVTNLAPVAEFASVDNRVCATKSITFENLTSGVATSYLWSFPGGNPSTSTLANPTVTYMVKGFYDVTLTATNITGSTTITKTAYVHIDSLSVATVTPTGNSTICNGQNIVLASQSQDPTFVYQWEKNNVIIPNATNATYTTGQQATYRVSVTNGLGCTKRSASKTVFTSQPTAPISASGNTTFCSGGNVQLQTNNTVGNTYQWRKNNLNINGANAFNYTASTNGSYRVLVTNSNGCTNISGVIPVRVNANPNVTVNASGPLTFCAGQSVTLSVNPQTNVTYQWKNNNVNIPGATTNQFTVTAAGKYRVSALNTVTTCSNQSSNKNVIVNCRLAAEGDANEIATFSASVFPNPANDVAKIYFELPNDKTVSIQMFDMTGRLVETLASETVLAGAHEFSIDANKYPSGIYFVTVNAGSEKQTLKFIIE